MRSGPGEGGGPGDFLAHPTCYIQMDRDRRDREPWPGVNCLNGPRVASKKNWATCSWEKNQGRERLISFFSRVLTSKNVALHCRYSPLAGMLLQRSVLLSHDDLSAATIALLRLRNNGCLYAARDGKTAAESRLAEASIRACFKRRMASHSICTFFLPRSSYRSPVSIGMCALSERKRHAPFKRSTDPTTWAPAPRGRVTRFSGSTGSAPNQ